jgi:hypothetical protein
MRFASRGSITLLALVACTDHLSIGSFEDAGDPAPGAEPNDGSLPKPDGAFLDAAAVGATSAPLEATLLVSGREDCSGIYASCGVPCADVEVEVRGGAPPYRIYWSDGVVTGTRRNVCFTPSVPRRAWISDVTDRGLALDLWEPFASGSGGGCAAGMAQVRSVCVAAAQAQLDCRGASGLWYRLQRPLQEAHITVLGGYAQRPLGVTAAQLGTASTACGDVNVLASGIVSELMPTLSGTLSGLTDPPQFVVFRAPLELDGRPPPSLGPIRIEICFEP